MIQIGREDLLRALKRFKGIAKQDLLPNNQIPQSDYWKTHAEARRETYTKLIDLVEEEGIEKACVFAFSAYQELPSSAEANPDPVIKGHTQALEMFFNVLGIATDKLKKYKEENTDFHQIFGMSSPEDIYGQNLEAL
ncbi:MAG: hypothetical protein ACM3X9_13875 [Bacillota bacterium]